MNFESIEYLKSGNLRQKSAYKLLTDIGIFSKLHNYHPILVGTIPLEIDIENSDLDIICCWKNEKQFITDLRKHFSKYNEFKINKVADNSKIIITANFSIENQEIEIFGQNIPTLEQRAYRHMLTEYRILKEKGDEFKQQIIALKRLGIKTEPAFAQLLGISGNPYIELLK